MAILGVPFVPQFNTTACGAASLEMVYRYLRPSKLSKFSQAKMYESLATAARHGAMQIVTDDLVWYARQRGLYAGWGRVSPSHAEMLSQIEFFVSRKKLPVIAVQRFSDEKPEIGHFRVIVGHEDGEVIFHDSFPGSGGESLRWPVSKFMDYWRRTGESVTGGVAC